MGQGIAERLERYSMPEPNTGCTLWFGVSLPAGYGRVSVKGSLRLAHRVAYELHHGPIPEGLVIDHLCNTPSCINPSHLKATTPAINGARSSSPYSANARKTHCIRGHELSGANLWLGRDGKKRICRKCNLAWQKRRYLKKTAGKVRDTTIRDACLSYKGKLSARQTAIKLGLTKGIVLGHWIRAREKGLIP